MEITHVHDFLVLEAAGHLLGSFHFVTLLVTWAKHPFAITSAIWRQIRVDFCGIPPVFYADLDWARKTTIRTQPRDSSRTDTEELCDFFNREKGRQGNDVIHLHTLSHSTHLEQKRLQTYLLILLQYSQALARVVCDCQRAALSTRL